MHVFLQIIFIGDILHKEVKEKHKFQVSPQFTVVVVTDLEAGEVVVTFLVEVEIAFTKKTITHPIKTKMNIVFMIFNYCINEM